MTELELMHQNNDLQQELGRLQGIIDALIDYNESACGCEDTSYSLFHKTALLEDEVSQRTTMLKQAISQLESVNRALALSKVKFQALFDLQPNPVVVSLVASGIMTDVNRRFCEFFGYPQEALIGFTADTGGVGIWTQANERENFIAQIRKNKGVAYGVEMRGQRADGTVADMLLSGRILFLGDEEILITELHEAGEYAQKVAVLRELAEHDPLTGLPNRLLILDRLQQATRYFRRNRHQLAVCYLDLDGFKAINDAHGHRMGDFVLTRTAERIQSCTRGSDTVGRMGGDEFLVLLLDLAGETECEEILSRIIQLVNEPVREQGGAEVCLGVSVGYTLFPDDPGLPAELIDHADQALYMVKRSGKNSIHRFQIPGDGL